METIDMSNCLFQMASPLKKNLIACTGKQKALYQRSDNDRKNNAGEVQW